MFRHEPADPAAEREARDSRRGDHPTGGRQTVEGRLAIELAPRDPALHASGPGLWIDVDPLHQGQVDHDAALADRATGDVVSATAHRDLEAVLFREGQGVDDVCRAAAPSDDRRPFVDKPVVDLPRVLVPVVPRDE